MKIDWKIYFISNVYQTFLRSVKTATVFFSVQKQKENHFFNILFNVSDRKTEKINFLFIVIDKKVIIISE